jgi:hypothetical protein
MSQFDEPISIPLHAKHWVIILAALEAVVKNADNRIQELKRQGVDHTMLAPAVVTSLAAPTIVRGIIVKALTDRGVMTPEANQQLGIDRIMEQIRKFNEGV